MSASPRFTFSDSEMEPVMGLVPFPAREVAGTQGDWLPVGAAAATIGVSASTLRRALNRVRADAPSGAARLEGECGGHWFEAWHTENGSRAQWKIRFVDRPIDVLPQEAVTRALDRVSEFRKGQTADWPEHALNHTPGRRHWWQLWRPA